MTDRYCHVLKAKCIGKRCISWEGGIVFQAHNTHAIEPKGDWQVQEPWCNCPMVSGYLQVDK